MSVTSQVLGVHEKVYKATDGRIGHRVLGVPCLLLRTKGRRSGATRTNGLVYAGDGDDYVVVASKGGDPKNPAWFLNLEANPEVEVQIGRERRKGTARVVARSDPDYERLWKLVNENNRDRYTEYQEKTDRPIPIVVITPA
ncbi:MAG TPA: nitroreductase family deazaflavin-dependent oxidoreductase [Solirubrobacterales bacterium]|jgi:deazaflavin-dependent oxidoreductase (nitroreductase family)